MNQSSIFISNVMMTILPVSATDDALKETIEKCSEGMRLIHDSESSLFADEIVGPQRLSLMQLESTLLTLAACPATAGLHFHLCLNGKILSFSSQKRQ